MSLLGAVRLPRVEKRRISAVEIAPLALVLGRLVAGVGGDGAGAAKDAGLYVCNSH
jgi:hypothetical protein